MAIGWFIVPFVRRADMLGMPAREPAIFQFAAAIRADGGAVSLTEILGDRAIVKVRASVSTLTTIAAAPTIRRIPLDRLDDPVSSLTVNQRQALRNEVLDAGYTQEEIDATIPDFSVVTLRQVLRFLCRRRLRPRYDSGTDTIVCDGPLQPVLPIEHVDREVE